MLIDFFLTLRKYGVPVSITELLDLLKALQAQLVFADLEQFYFLARLCLVKDEIYYDRFDRACAEYFDGVSAVDLSQAIPAEWLIPGLIKQLSEAEKAALKGEGSLEKLLEKFQQRLQEQQERHAGGNKWIGTGGTSPFGAGGFHPEGIRVGPQGKQRKAVKVWQQREFAELDVNDQFNHRSMKLALRQLRRFARTGARLELDLSGTIHATSKQGWLDLQFLPERHNAIKVLMLFDIGGSMDDYIEQAQQLFSAAHLEFKHLEYFYFHNCVYENVWTKARRHSVDAVSVQSLIHTYSRDYKLIFVGDATMGPYEISYPGGSVEHFNAESGEIWLQRLLQHFSHAVWLNPQPESYWSAYPSISQIDNIMQQRMFCLSLQGLSDAIKTLLTK